MIETFQSRDSVLGSWSNKTKKEHKGERIMLGMAAALGEERAAANAPEVSNKDESSPASSRSSKAERRKSGASTSYDVPVCATPEIFEKVGKAYTHILGNEYKGGANGRTMTDEYMVCECQYEPGGDMRHQACGDDACINRALFIECMGESCPSGQYCQNRRFQKRQYASIEIFETDKKGFGLRAAAPIPSGSFVIEYCGEVITSAMFKKRTQEYDKQGVKHFYFMTLKANEFIDASKRGNMSRFMNHSCFPNCALHKWVVGPNWRIGMFTVKDIAVGEELTFDYKFERYGAKAQQCFCGASNCKGFIGGKQAEMALDSDDDSDSEPEDPNVKRPARRKKQGGRDDSDYEGTPPVKPTGGLRHDQDLQHITRSFLRHAGNPRRVRKLLRKIENADSYLLRRFIWAHGLRILKMCLDEHIGKDKDICLQVLRILGMLPLAHRNEKVEECVAKLAALPDLETSDMAKELLDRWSTLQKAYKIPKRIPPVSQPPAIKLEDSTNHEQASPAPSGSSKRSHEENDSHRDDSYSPRYKRYRNDDRDVYRRYQNGYSRQPDMYRPASYPISRPYAPDHSDHQRREFWPHNREPDYYDNYGPRFVDSQRPYQEHAPAASSTRSLPCVTNADDRASAFRTAGPPFAYAERRFSDLEKPLPPLPPGWERAVSDGSVFYFHRESNTSQWEYPRAPEENDLSQREYPRPPIETSTSQSKYPQAPTQSIDSAITAAIAAANAAPHKRASPATPSDERRQTPALPSEFPKKRKHEIGVYVTKLLSNYQIPAIDFKELARKVAKGLVEKELKTRTQFEETLSDRAKASIYNYIKEWCARKNFARKKRPTPNFSESGTRS